MKAADEWRHECCFFDTIEATTALPLYLKNTILQKKLLLKYEQNTQTKLTLCQQLCHQQYIINVQSVIAIFTVRDGSPQCP